MSFVSHLTNVIEAEYLSHRGLPNAPDGAYEPAQEDPGVFLNTLSRIQRQTHRGLPISQDPYAIRAFVQALQGTLTHNGVNDREHAFEDGLEILSKMDPKAPFMSAMNNLAITGLYGNLPHPPNSLLGDYRFRQADGSYNNIYWPEIGRAGRPYARNAQPHTPIPNADLPDPGLVFDALLQRRDTPGEDNNHPNGNSAFTFAFASLVTHTLFRTDPRNNTSNNTSSYLDLSPLYGNSQAEQNLVRNKDGRGQLYPDCFFEDRLIHLPPAASALLIIFNRNHNYTADMLLKINECGLWKDPSSFPADHPDLLKQDEQIFQTARLINCGHFMSMIFNDYLAGFLGNAKNGHSWHMKPFNKMYRLDGTEVGRGEGNHVSVEFNLLYRWHATIADGDEAWTSRMMSNIFQREDLENLTVQDFMRVAHDPNSGLYPTEEPRLRDLFPGTDITRGADGRYKDADIAGIIQQATSEPAHRYGARATPASLRIIEMLTIMQGRKWGVCTMNEFRRCMGLRPFSSFEEWNSNPEIANAARQLYIHIDRLELYPGLQAEETMELRPGSGFCTGYTMMRAILADAISLVRGDRFFTTDFTPGNLTAWGFGDVKPVQDNGAFGACLPKLLMRHLPNDYSFNSVYGLFPFFTPESMAVALEKQEVKEKYDFAPPRSIGSVAVVQTLKGIRAIFDDYQRFEVPYTADMKYLTQGYGFFLVFDEFDRHKADRHLALQALWGPEGSMSDFTQFYKKTTIDLIREHSFLYDVPSNSPFRGHYVDIVRNVINLTSVRWASEYLTGLSLKTKENPHGEFTEHEAYQMLMVLFMCVFENLDTEHGWFLRTTAKGIADKLNAIIENSLEQVRPKHIISRFFARASTIITSGSQELVTERPCYGFLRRLTESGRDLKDLIATVIGLAVGSSVNYAQASAQIVDFYLDDDRKAERAKIVALCATPETDEEANQKLIGYIKEAQRLAPQFPGLSRICRSHREVRIAQGNGLPDVVVQPGQTVYGSYYKAQTDPHDFTDPLTVNPDRPRGNYAVQGIGFHGCPGVQFAERTLLSVMRVIFSLRNLRRATGYQGKLASFQSEQNGTPARLFLDDQGAMSPWPGQLMVAYDA